jgi:hypothetical protein
MAGTNLQTRVLCGVHVVRDVLVGRTCIGFQQARTAASAFLSPARHLLPRYSQAVQEPGLRHFEVHDNDLDNAAFRAGRPGSRTGALAGRSSAISAGQTVLGRWCAGTSGRTAAGCSASGTVSGRMSPERFAGNRLPAFLRPALHAGGPMGRMATDQPGKRKQPGMAWSRPYRGTLVASTRGKGV